MKRVPQTAIAYANYLYMAGNCNGAVAPYTDHDIVAIRARAFDDGARWARRKMVRERALRKPKRR